MKQQEEEHITSTWGNVNWTPLSALSRRIGHRYGFSSISLDRREIALFGGAVHFEAGAALAKGDIEKGNPIPFSQVHCIGPIHGQPLNCLLLGIKPAADLPCPRLYHSASRLNTSVIIFGGLAFSDRRKLSDIWCLVIQPLGSSSPSGEPTYTGEWSELAPALKSTSFPPPRSHHAVASVTGTDTVIVSGGCGFEETVLGDMWAAICSMGEKSVHWKRVNSPIGKVPVPRMGHALSPLVSDIELLLFGGNDASGVTLSDLWICQFTNEEKTRCVWTELVSGPHPRSGHILVPSNGNLLVFGGTCASGDRYDLASGTWSSSPFVAGQGHAFTAVELDVIYDIEKEEFPVQSVLLIPDNVSRASPAWPFVASIFAVDITPEVSPPTTPLIKVKKDTNIEARRSLYREIASQIPSVKIHTRNSYYYQQSDISTAVIPIQTTRALPHPADQSVFHIIDYIASNLFGSKKTFSASSWSGHNNQLSHVLVTSKSNPAVTSLASFRDFINDPVTFKLVSETSSSALFVLNLADGDKVFGFVSESLQRHAKASLYVSPVCSVKSTSYAQVQATLRLITVYTPFKTSAAVAQLFALYAVVLILLV